MVTKYLHVTHEGWFCFVFMFVRSFVCSSVCLFLRVQILTNDHDVHNKKNFKIEHCLDVLLIFRLL